MKRARASRKVSRLESFWSSSAVDMERTVWMYGWMKSSMILRLRRNSVRDMAKLKTLLL